MTIEVKIDSKKLERALKAAPHELNRAMQATAARVGQRFVGFHRARRLRGPPGVRGSRKGLLSAFRYDIQGKELKDIQLTIGTKSRVALEHEEGRTITGRGGSLLVPLRVNGKEMSRAQIQRARGLLKARQLILVIAKNGQKFLGERRGARSPLRLLFAFVKAVKLKPRLAFRSTWKEFLPTAVKLFNGGVSAALRAARRKGG